MSKAPSHNFHRVNQLLFGVVVIFFAGVATILAGAVIWYMSFFSSHLPPRISINSIDVGGLTYAQALEKLELETAVPQQYQVTLTVDEITIASSSAELGLQYRFADEIDKLEHSASQGGLRDRLLYQFNSFFYPQLITVPLSYDTNAVQNMLKELDTVVGYAAEEPAATLGISGNANSIRIFPGKQGRMIDSEATAALLMENTSASQASLSAIVASTSAQLSKSEVEKAEEKAKLFVGKYAYFTFENTKFELDDTELVALLGFPEGINQTVAQNITDIWKERLNRPAQEPVFEYDPQTLEVKTFIPPRNGQTLDQTETLRLLDTALTEISAEAAQPSNTPESEAKTEYSYQLRVATTPPNKSLSQTNNLGISERIGFGDSHYDHSIPNRVHNVALTTERVSDKIIPPGGEFSFNKAVGDVSSKTGYKSAYVIMNGKTVLGDGGGVCQVSTTVFRSVLNAGLQITRRLPHSYRVSYYELDSKPGVDATVYSGETDFRFVNDTDQHILLHAEADSKNMYMFVELYGTSDGRTAEIVDHITWNYRNPPPPQYYPDPSLPAGKLKQIDWSAPGISASFVNRIKDKDGNIIREDKYVSNYRPWAAKYLQGVAQ